MSSGLPNNIKGNWYKDGVLITPSATELNLLTGLLAAPFSQFKIISTSYDISTANGNKALSGAGFTPRKLLLFAADNNGGPTFSVGGWDGSGGFGIGNYSASSAAVTGFTSTTGWQLLLALNNTNFVTATVNSLDSDGFTLAMSKTGSPTGTVNIFGVCIR